MEVKNGAPELRRGEGKLLVYGFPSHALLARLLCAFDCQATLSKLAATGSCTTEFDLGVVLRSTATRQKAVLVTGGFQVG